jgi:hypothetical protein
MSHDFKAYRLAVAAAIVVIAAGIFFVREIGEDDRIDGRTARPGAAAARRPGGLEVSASGSRRLAVGARDAIG